MMFYVTIDCGTTNSRIYIVNKEGEVIAKASKSIGVRDTAVNGSNEILKKGISDLFREVIESSHISPGDIKVVLSSGMITSELGLVEIPHLWAPCGISELAFHLWKEANNTIFMRGIPFYLVPGIKNRFNPNTISSNSVGDLDFMRGEETQVAGILKLHLASPPLLIVILSSHTKFISVDAEGSITGSITTMSGQLYDAIINHTFVGKSVSNDGENVPKEYFSESVIDNAKRWINTSGLVRSLMFPRFMDVLIDTKWYERKLFVDALIAAEDLKVIPQLSEIGTSKESSVILVGDPARCKIYDYLLRQSFSDSRTFIHVTDTKEIDNLSIQGILGIADKAGVL
jgi:2-dehydro-3-deoxygalactonokinase